MAKIIRILVLIALVVTAGTFYYLGLRDQANLFMALGVCSELVFYAYWYFSRTGPD